MAGAVAAALATEETYGKYGQVTHRRVYKFISSFDAQTCLIRWELAMFSEIRSVNMFVLFIKQNLESVS